MIAIPANEANANINYSEIYKARYQSEQKQKKDHANPIIIKANPAGIFNLPLEMIIEIPQDIKPIRLRKLTNDEIKGRNTPFPPIPKNGTNK